MEGKIGEHSGEMTPIQAQKWGTGGETRYLNGRSNMLFLDTYVCHFLPPKTGVFGCLLPSPEALRARERGRAEGQRGKDDVRSAGR